MHCADYDDNCDDLGKESGRNRQGNGKKRQRSKGMADATIPIECLSFSR